MAHDVTSPSPVAAGHKLPGSAPPHSRRKVIRIALWCLLAVAIVLVVLLIARRGDPKRTTPVVARIPVTTATATKGSIGEYLDAIGTVTPVYTASITSQVSGLIVAVHFKEGQQVKKGDPLIDIDPRPYRATVLQAQGTLERDENLLAEAQMDAQRYRDAWARHSIAKQVLDDQEKVVLQDQGTVKNDSGTVQYDEVQLAYCHITAPIHGRVGLRLVDPGNVVQATGNVTLAVVTQLDPITVLFSLSE